MKFTKIAALLVLVAQPVLAAELPPVRGVVIAGQETTFSVDLQSRVSSTPFKTGESFARGDTLMTFECTAQQATSRAAMAELQAAKATYKNNLELKKYDAIGQYDVDISKAERDIAVAQTEAANAILQQCQIIAPYNGRVSELHINSHETPQPNQPLLKVVSTDSPELKMIVPSDWLLWLKPDMDFSFTVDETGKRYQAKVLRIGAEVDPISKTVLVMASTATSNDTLLPGMSGTALFSLPLN